MLTLRSKTVSVSLITALLAGCSGSKQAGQAPQPEAKPAANSTGAALAGAEAQKAQDLNTPTPVNPSGAGAGGASDNNGSATFPSLPGGRHEDRVVRYSHSYESHAHYRYRRVTSCSSESYTSDCGFDLHHKTKRPTPKAVEPKNVRSLETVASLEYTANGSVGGGSGGKPKPQAQKSLGSPTPLSSVPSGASGALASTRADSASSVTYVNVRSDGGKSFDALRGLYNGATSTPDNIVLQDDAQGAVTKEWFTQAKKVGADAYIYQMSSTQDLSASGNVLKYELAIPVSTLQLGPTLTDRKNTPLSAFKPARIADVTAEKVEADKANKVLIIEAMTAGSANETLIKKGDWEQAIATMKPSVGRTIVTSQSADGIIKIHCWIGFPRVEKLAKAKRAKEFEKLSQNQPAALAESSSICTISGLVD